MKLYYNIKDEVKYLKATNKNMKNLTTTNIRNCKKTLITEKVKSKILLWKKLKLRKNFWIQYIEYSFSK